MPRATRPIGRLIQKIQRQPGPSVSSPPSSGPATEDRPKTAPKYPMYLPRSRGGITSPMVAKASDIRPPAPRPWTARKPISISMFCDSADRTEPARKVTIAAMNSGRRP